MSVRWRKVAGCGALAVAGVLAIAVLVLTFMDWNLLKRPLEHIASGHLKREVTIGGALQAKVWSRTPTISVDELQIGNPPWESGNHFLTVDHLQVKLELPSLLRGHVVLARVALIRPTLYIHREKSGRANWTFENTAPSDERAAAPPNLPAVRNAVIEEGKLILVDEVKRMRLTGTVEAHEQFNSDEQRPFRVDARGTLNNQPFQLAIAGGPLLSIDPEHPYPFDLNMKSGQFEVTARGQVLKPFDLSGLDMQVAARGHDTADLFYLTQLALPNSPPYQVRARIARKGQLFKVSDIKGTLGSTDIGGSVNVDATRKRPSIVARLNSQHLVLKDVGAVTGSRVGTNPPEDGKPAAATPAAARPAVAANSDRLFPDAHLQLNRVQAMDADVRFSANSIDAGVVPFTHVSMAVTLKDGDLNMHSMQFQMPQGRVNALMDIDTRVRPPKVHLDFRAADVDLQQLKPRKPDAKAPLAGIIQARAVVDGRGDSVRSVMADADGKLIAVIPNGEIRSAFAELTGIDVAKGVGLLFTKPDERAAIRCGVADFGLQDGIAHAQNMVVDTQNVLITGTGKVELGSEKLDLSVKGQPKKLRLVRVRSPIKVEGQLLKPKVALEGGHLVRQGGVAAALGVVLTPLAAVLAFVDPGLAKDQNCVQLMQAYENKSLLGAPGQAQAQSPSGNLLGKRMESIQR
jgi:uncharacterized protein involved in outer membrane biogenesis